jgi:hypothetical protein
MLVTDAPQDHSDHATMDRLSHLTGYLQHEQAGN